MADLLSRLVDGVHAWARTGIKAHISKIAMTKDGLFMDH